MVAFLSPLASRKLRAQRSAHSSTPETGAFCATPLSRLHFWRDTRGQTHLATVYSLIECPAMPPSVALIVTCDGHGRREVRAVQLLTSPHATVNLAEVRQIGACHGSNEVHLLTSLPTPDARGLLARDLAEAHGAPYFA